MPAVRKPTVLLEASGAFEHDPQRARPHEPAAGGVGPAPEHLAEPIRKAWDEIVGNCAAGVFQSSDRLMLERLATLLVRSRGPEAMFGSRSEALLLTMLARCGMTPSDRSRVLVPRGQAPDKPKTGLASFRR